MHHKVNVSLWDIISQSFDGRSGGPIKSKICDHYLQRMNTTINGPKLIKENGSKVLSYNVCNICPERRFYCAECSRKLSRIV